MGSARVSRQLSHLTHLVVALVLLAGIGGLHVGHMAKAQTNAIIVVDAVNPDGSLLPGGCFATRPIGGAYFGFFSTCDSDDGALDGVTTIYPFSSVEQYALFQVTAPDGYKVGTRTEVTVPPGTTLTVDLLQEEGGETINFSAVDPDGNGVQIGCVDLIRNNGIASTGLGDPVAHLCMPDGATDGRFSFTGIPTGDFVALLSGTDDYAPRVFSQVVRVRSDQETPVELLYREMFDGLLRLNLFDAAGDPFVDDNACIQVRAIDPAPELNSIFFFACDASDGSTEGSFEPDGTILLPNLPDGPFEFQSQFPPGWQVVIQPFEIEGGGTTELDVTLEPGGQTISIHAPPSEGGATSPGCFNVFEDAGLQSPDAFSTFVCTDLLADGSFGGSVAVPVGTFHVVNVSTQMGFAAVPDQTVEVGRGDAVTVEVAPVAAGSIRVEMLDANGKVLRNWCFTAMGDIDGYGNSRLETFDRFSGTCDADDGVVDGITNILGLPAGRFDVVPVAAPSGYQLPERQAIRLSEGENAELLFEGAKGGGRLTITIDMGATHPLSHLWCTTIYVGDSQELSALATFRCDTWDGTRDGRIVVSGLPAGDYTVTHGFTNGWLSDRFEGRTVIATVTDGESSKVTLGAVPVGGGDITPTPDTD